MVDQWIVTFIGIGLIIGIVWFFWFKPARADWATLTGDVQEASITVKGGYTPDTILVRQGRRVRLHFLREETASCSEVVQFPDFSKSAHLPTGESVSIEFIPHQKGEFEFACPMGMLRGKLVVE